MKKILEYLKYPSTYKGLIALLAIVGLNIAPEQQEAITTLGIAVYGIISVFFSDSDVA